MPLTPISNDTVSAGGTNEVSQDAEHQTKEDEVDVTINTEDEKSDVKWKTSPTTKGTLHFLTLIYLTETNFLLSTFHVYLLTLDDKSEFAFILCTLGGWNFIFNRNKKNKQAEDVSKPVDTELKDLFLNENKDPENDTFTAYCCDQTEEQSEMSEDHLSKYPPICNTLWFCLRLRDTTE